MDVSGDINSVFEDIALSENKFTDQGFSEGIRAAENNCHSEGEELGYTKGKQIGTEIGFYAGFVEEYKQIYKKPETKKEEKIVSALNKLDNLLSAFPDYNCQENFEEKLEEIRAKFKLIGSLLKISSEFNLNTTSW